MRWLFRMLYGEPGSGLSDEEKQMGSEIRALKTLRVFKGHISIDPSEVVTENFIKCRKDAARLIN